MGVRGFGANPGVLPQLDAGVGFVGCFIPKEGEERPAQAFLVVFALFIPFRVSFRFLGRGFFFHSG